MDDLFSQKKEKRGINKGFLFGIGAAILALAVVFGLLSRKPSIEDQTAQILAGALREGSPEYADLNKDIIISTDDETVQSPTGLGTISMFIKGNIRNKGTRTIDILEVSVSVVTQFNEVLRERKILVVPVQHDVLGPNEMIPITLTFDGFKREDDRANIRWKVTAIKAK